ncbi:MAG: DNA replication/repair protein RecF [Clostridia bacterium]|nr:DNA replication/repair protein RecF [Clostridia bacterium]
MRVTELTFEGFRNLHPGRWQPDGGVNILYGDNAQGKTNLLEACWLFTGGRSFRGAKDSEMVQFGAEAAKLEMAFEAGGRSQDASITIRQRRSVLLNGVSLPSASKLAGTFCGVVFSPAHLSLIKDGPEGRRRFIDAAYCQLKPAYIGVLSEFHTALTQRNALLKQCREMGTLTPEMGDLLDLWDHTLAAASARLTAARQHYVRRLQPMATEIYRGLSLGRETFEVAWETPITAAPLPEMAAQWMDAYRQARRADVAVGFSTVGPHREDLIVTIQGQLARSYGSQGQQRSAVLALKLAEATLLEEVTDEKPVAFLDDVMSELDTSRQDYILNHIDGWQVFITCCEPSAALKNTAAKVFSVKQGVISE